MNTNEEHQQRITAGHAAAAESTDAMRLSDALEKEAAVLEQQAYALGKEANADPDALKKANARAATARAVAAAADKYWRSVNVRWSTMRRYSDANPDWKPPANSQTSLSEALRSTLDPNRIFMAAKLNPALFFMLLALWAGLIHYADVGKWRRIVSVPLKVAAGTLHAAAHVAALLIVGRAPEFIFRDTLPYTWNSLPEPISGLALLIGVWSENEMVNMLFQALTLVLLGGFLGAMIFAVYWSIMSTLFARHSDDAFGALGLRHYKHFLRMKFEADRLTIYPVAIDKVPGRKGWRPAGPEHGQSPYNGPKIVPKKELGPRLIEDPIVIPARRAGA